MKIDPMTRKILKESAIPITLGFIGLISAGAFVHEANKDRKLNSVKHEHVKEYVKQHNPDLYKEYSYTNRPIVDYYEAARDIREDLKLDSIAKTNYALGIQAAKDSLVSASKK